MIISGRMAADSPKKQDEPKRDLAKKPPEKLTPGYTMATSNLFLKRSGKNILSNINLSFFPGKVSAILGPSGSGKSTLVKCLTTVFKASKGLITMDGKKLWKERATFRQSLGYVPQDDIIHTELKVRQAFMYAARLRLDPEIPDKVIENKIDHLCGQLGLGDHKKKRIRRLSGGQRKRVNIGIELLADPRVLVLDEPASGLDPGTEEDLLKILRGLANTGKTVVLTTHSMEYLDRVDRVVVLVDGAAVFSGTLESLLRHFDIPHAAEVFKKLRTQSVDHWVQRAGLGGG